MRSLRYWLGMPLFNLMILLLFCVLPFVLGSVLGEDGSSLAIYFAIVLWYGGLFFIPLLTGLYYPAGKAENLPLWTPILVSFFMTFVTWAVVWAVNSGDAFPESLIALPIALVLTLVEILGYSVGLLIAKAIANAKQNKRGT